MQKLRFCQSAYIIPLNRVVNYGEEMEIADIDLYKRLISSTLAEEIVDEIEIVPEPIKDENNESIEINEQPIEPEPEQIVEPIVEEKPVKKPRSRKKVVKND